MKKNCDAIVLLGYRLNDDGSAHPEMKQRCEKAAEVWKDGVAPVIVACGGPTGKSGRTEAEVMKELLVGMGVAPESVILEDKSMITTENIVNAQKILGAGKKRLALVSSDYHVFRAGLMCRQAGYAVDKYPAPSQGGEIRRCKNRLERIFTVKLLLGWEKPGSNPPSWVSKIMRRRAMAIIARIREEEKRLGINQEFRIMTGHL